MREEGDNGVSGGDWTFLLIIWSIIDECTPFLIHAGVDNMAMKN